MGTWSIGLLCFKVFVVIEIESIAQAPETLPPFFFFFPVIHPQAFKEKQDALYILVGGRHCTLHTERATKLLFSVSEAYSGLMTKRNTQNKQKKKNKKKITGWRATANSCAVQKNEWIWLHTLYMESNAPKNGVSEWYTSQIIFSIVWKYFVIKYCHKREIKHENNN